MYNRLHNVAACLEAVQMRALSGAGTRGFVPAFRLAMMQKWRRRSLALAALLALLASLVPTPAWSCPATGRVGSAAFVCEGMARPCAFAHSSCCRPVTLPTGIFDAQGRPDQPLALAPAARPLRIEAASAKDSPTEKSLGLAVVLGAQPMLGLGCACGCAGAVASFSFRSRHGPSACSGRAPPLA